MSRRAPRYFAYTPLDDNWGCTYRSVQNVCVGVHLHPVPDIRTMVTRVAGRRLGQWAEPAMFTTFFRDRGYSAHTFRLGRVTPKFTRTSQYETHLPASSVQDGFFTPGFCYVVDDSVSTFAVVTAPGGTHLLWVDPHVAEPGQPAIVEPFSPQRHMGAAPGWLVLRVRCKPTKGRNSLVPR